MRRLTSMLSSTGLKPSGDEVSVDVVISPSQGKLTFHHIYIDSDSLQEESHWGITFDLSMNVTYQRSPTRDVRLIRENEEMNMKDN